MQELGTRLAGLRTEVGEEEAKRTAATAGAGDAERRLAALQASIAAGQTERAALEERLRELRQAVAAAAAERDGLAATPVAMEPAGAGRRSPAAVTAAVAAAPGLADADAEVRAALIAELERGACVTDALTAAVGAINRLTAASLVRGLGAC